MGENLLSCSKNQECIKRGLLSSGAKLEQLPLISGEK